LEFAQFSKLASSIYFNSGLHASQVATIDAMTHNLSSSDGAQPILVVDPEGLGTTQFRTDQILYVLESCKPAVIKCNISEILLLAKESSNNIDIQEAPNTEMLTELARLVSAKYSSIVAVLGVNTTIVVDGERVGRLLQDGKKQLTKFSGSSTVEGALCAAAVCVTPDDLFMGVITALAAFQIAAKEAMKESKGPGTLSINVID